jgi:hypothetical protein
VSKVFNTTKISVYTPIIVFTLFIGVINTLVPLRQIKLLNTMELQKFAIVAFFVYALFKFFRHGLYRNTGFKVDSIIIAWFVLNIVSVFIAALMQRNGLNASIDFFVISSAMFIYWLGRNYFTYDSLRTFKIISGILLCAEILNVSFGYILVYLGYSFYFSIGTVYALFPLSYFLVKRNYLFVFVTALIIVLGAKAGVIFSMVMVLMIYFMKNMKGIGKVVGIVFVVSFVSMVILLKENNPDIRLLEIVFRKFDYYNPVGFFTGEKPFSEFINFGGGRVSEIYYSISKSFDEQGWFFLLFGGGAGFTYESIYLEELYEVKNAHFSPVSLLTKYGIAAVILFYFYGFKKLRFSVKSENINIMSYFVCGSLFYTLTAFTVFTNLLFWFFLGNIAALRNYNMVEYRNR